MRFASQLLLIAIATAASQVSYAQEEPKSPPPLPLHGIEGSGGIFSTYSAYLVNPAAEGKTFGLPSMAGFFVYMGPGSHLEAVTLTETLWNRVEFGYGWNGLDIGDLHEDIRNNVGVDLEEDDYVQLHNFNARVALLHEGDFEQPWVPAVTFGVHYKYNDTVSDINDRLGGALSGIGVDDNDGFDFTLYSSKMITALPRPVLINLGVRATEANHIGLLGFTDGYDFVAEGNVGVFLTDRLVLAGEYRQKPNDYDTIPGLIEHEADWWTILLAYVVNDHLVIGGGYANFDHVLNHECDGAWGLQVKWEF